MDGRSILSGVENGLETNGYLEMLHSCGGDKSRSTSRKETE